MNFDARLAWNRQKNLTGTSFLYGDPSTCLTREPAVYRWGVEDSAGAIKKVYIGETENLRRRVYHYLNPGPSQKTNMRLKEQFLNWRTEGLFVYLDILSIEPLTLNGVRFSTATLSLKPIRKVLESLMCLMIEAGHECLNL